MQVATRHGPHVRRSDGTRGQDATNRPRPRFCAMDSEGSHEAQLAGEPSSIPDHKTLVHLCLSVCARGEAGLFPVTAFTSSDWLLYFSKGRPDHSPVFFCFVLNDTRRDLRDYLY